MYIHGQYVNVTLYDAYRRKFCDKITKIMSIRQRNLWNNAYFATFILLYVGTEQIIAQQKGVVCGYKQLIAFLKPEDEII